MKNETFEISRKNSEKIQLHRKIVVRTNSNDFDEELAERTYFEDLLRFGALQPEDL